MKPQLWLGVSKIDITPQSSVPLAGFATRSEAGGFEDVAHPLFARIFYFRHEDAEGKETVALLVSADLIWWGSERVPQLKEQVKTRWGIPEQSILFHGTHNHSGPQTSTMFSDLLGKPDLRYIVELEASILEGIGKAIDDQEAVSGELIKGRSGISVNRRKMENGECTYKANHDGPLDTELQIIRYRTKTGKQKAVLVHFACHPVITMENVVSSEFCGVAMEMLERQMGGQVVAGYLQGFCADINPVGRDGELILQGDDAEVKRIAARFAEEIRETMEGEGIPLIDRPLNAKVVSLPIPLQKPPTTYELVKLLDEPWVMGEWSRKLLEQPSRLEPQISLEMTVLTLAEQLTVITANAEMVAEYGMHLKRMTEGHVLSLGYTNGMIGYVPTAQQIAEGGYEAYWSTHYFLLPAPLSTEVESLVIKTMQDIFYS